jgi:hypothetical protein
VSGELPQQHGERGRAGHVVQVLVGRREAVDHPALPPVDQRQRERPQSRGDAGQRGQRPPRQAFGPRRAARHHDHRDDDGHRRARPDVGQPLRQQRRERQVQGRPVREEAPTDRRGRDHERTRGRDDDEISPPRSPEPADPAHRRTVRPGSGDHARNRRSPTRAPKTTADAPNSTAHSTSHRPR